MRRWLSAALGERGNVLAMVIFMLTTILAFSGVAVDIGRVIAVKAELQRAVDAGALAGAAQLGFNSVPFPTARTAAVTWANKNPWSGGPTTLDPNNNVQFGVWGSGTWTDWDGTEIGTNGAIYVNAVRCSGWSATVPTLFLGLIGKPTISVSAFSTALSNPPSPPPPGEPVEPFALPICKFNNNGSSGCGALVAIDTNGWVDLTGNGNSNLIDSQLVNAADGAPAPASL